MKNNLSSLGRRQFPQLSVCSSLVCLVVFWALTVCAVCLCRSYEWHGHEYGHGRPVALHVTAVQ